MRVRRGIQKVRTRSRRQLVREWDELATHRERLISSGRDISYSRILLPSLRELAVKYLEPGVRVLDVGCGTGTFVSQLAEENPKVDFVGIDPSPRSIEIAVDRHPRIANCAFEAMPIEEFGANEDRAGFDLVIANMLLQNVASLPDALSGCVRVMRDDAVLVFALPHPCFWPRYWGYEDKSWYRYNEETWIEAPFRTSLSRRSTLRTSHTHRPLSQYINAFAQVGLLLEALQEPMPDEGVAGEYPEAWKFPRFLLGRCVRDPRR